MKIGMISLGCPKNLVDSEVMLGLAQRDGHQLTRDPAVADVLIVNTCAFIDKAKQESIDAILEMAEYKKTGACRRLVVTGCLAERYKEDLRAQIPEIDAVLGTGEVDRIVGTMALPGSAIGDRGSGIGVALFRANGQQLYPGSSGVPSGAPSRADARIPNPRSPIPNPAIANPGSRIPAGSPIPDPGAPIPDTLSLIPEPGSAIPVPGSRPLPTYLYDADTPRLLATPRHYAYVKIAEGCDYKCSFCIIPRLRGKYRSRSIDSIVREAESLAARGVKELLLISQDTTFYGVDRGERGALARLLRTLNRVDGLEWIRMLYLYPTTIGDDMLDAMAESEKVCNYIDLPLQHAADAVLRRMKRPGTGASYERLLDRIRRRVPGATIRTTFIVGFPGETPADFSELERFVGTVGFDHMGVFTYSHEEGTTAHGLADDVPGRVKRQRQSRLMSLQKRIVTRAQKGRVGQRVRLLVDGPSADHELVLRARLEGQAPDIDPLVYLTECDPSEVSPGELIQAEIVGSRSYDLVARPLPGTVTTQQFPSAAVVAN